VNENEYKAPSAKLNPSNAELKATAVLGSRPGWFNARPLPVFIIAGFCVLQFAGILYFLSAHWQDVMTLLRTGTESLFGFVVTLVYPALLCLAGVLLLFMRKEAVIAFGI
jgi:hypothetical protein